MLDRQRPENADHLAAGLVRAALAAALFPVLVWTSTVTRPAAFLAAGLALVCGVLLAAGRPRTLAREPLAQATLDSLLVGLLVAGTGGGGSTFFPLYFVAALGLVAVPGRLRVASAAAAMVGGYLAAVVFADGLGALATGPVGLRAALLVGFCVLAALMGARMRELAGRERALSTALDTERDRAARAEAAIPGVRATLWALSLEEILSWTVRSAREACGGTYAHVAVPEGNHHASLFEGTTDACPSWWHPTIQGLVLRARREAAPVHAEEEVHDIKRFLAVPLGSEGDVRGAVIVGGGDFGPGAERVLAVISGTAARALEGAVEAPGGRDPVTGLPNRASLHRVLRGELSRGGTPTVFAVELGGPAAGDDLLRRIGRRLTGGRRAFRSGDGFIVVMGGTDEARAGRATLAIRRAIFEEAGDLVQSAVGFVHAGQGPDDPDLLVHQALDAARRAKEAPDGVHSQEPGTGGGGIVDALLGALEAKDPGIGEHLRGVAGIWQDIAREMGWSDREIEELVAGALLHDVGKIGIPDHILHKPGRLTDEEYEVIKRHPVLGARIVAPVDGLAAMLPMISHHHERFDGKGYPDGLGGEEIPLAARIVAVADAFDSMVRGRPYGYGVPREAALRELEAKSGTQFDPAVVRALREVLAGRREDHSFG